MCHHKFLTSLCNNTHRLNLKSVGVHSFILFFTTFGVVINNLSDAKDCNIQHSYIILWTLLPLHFHQTIFFLPQIHLLPYFHHPFKSTHLWYKTISAQRLQLNLLMSTRRPLPLCPPGCQLSSLDLCIVNCQCNIDFLDFSTHLSCSNLPSSKVAPLHLWTINLNIINPTDKGAAVVANKSPSCKCQLSNTSSYILLDHVPTIERKAMDLHFSGDFPSTVSCLKVPQLHSQLPQAGWPWLPHCLNLLLL